MNRPSSKIYQIGYRALPEGALKNSPIIPIALTFWLTRWRLRSTKTILILGAGIFLLHAGWLFFQLLGEKVASNINTPPGTLTPEHVIGSTQEVLSRFLSSQFYVSAIAAAASRSASSLRSSARVESAE